MIPKYAATQRGWFAARIATRASARNPRREPVGDALRHPGQFREGDALDCLLALNLKGNVIGELAGRFLKALVEGGHVRGEYTKDSWGKLGTGPILRLGRNSKVMKKITFSADEDKIELAREVARSEHKKLNDAFRDWLELVWFQTCLP